MPEYQHWTPRGRKREPKEPVMHPVARELAMRAQFVERARAYFWRELGPSPLPHVGWPPGWSPRAAVAEYWALLITKTHQHAPHLLQPEPTTLEESVDLALTLSASNPLLEF